MRGLLMGCRCNEVKKAIKGHTINAINRFNPWHIDDPRVKKRLDICNNCPNMTRLKLYEYAKMQWNKPLPVQNTGKNRVCSICGCLLVAKACIEDEQCAEGKWLWI